MSGTRGGGGGSVTAFCRARESSSTGSTATMRRQRERGAEGGCRERLPESETCAVAGFWRETQREREGRLQQRRAWVKRMVQCRIHKRSSIEVTATWLPAFGRGFFATVLEGRSCYCLLQGCLKKQLLLSLLACQLSLLRYSAVFLCVRKLLLVEPLSE